MAGVASFLTNKVGLGGIGYFTKGIGSKLVAFGICIFLFQAGFKLLGELLPSMNFSTMFDGLPGAFIYGLWFIDAPYALNAFLAAYATAFLIKRIPVIG